MLRSLDWKPTHQLGDSSLEKEMQEKMGKIMSVVVARSRNCELTRIMEDVLGPPDGRPITKQDAKELSRRFAELAARILFGG